MGAQLRTVTVTACVRPTGRQMLVDTVRAFFRLQSGCRQRAKKHYQRHYSTEQLVLHLPSPPIRSLVCLSR